MKKCSLLFIVFSVQFLAFSQSPQTATSADMYLNLQKLKVLGSVLYVAAHPDDENTRLIAYMAKDKLYRTGYLSLTRGDGGQNLIGDEQGVDLGLIRTQELLAARRVDAGEQFFSRAFDFGYSKTPSETFEKWNKEKILSDVVWVIRKLQPDVIITRFPTTGEGGHGHHTASAIIANEAFVAAADSTRFSEQLKYVKPWQAKRILWNTFNFSGNNTTGNDQFKIDVGGYNPLLGKSYGEIAAISRSNHKSQGFGSAATRGEMLEHFKTTGGSAPVDDLMNGIEPSWKRVKGAEGISAMIDNIISAFDLLHPEKSVKELVKLHKAIITLPDGYWKTKKLLELQQLIEQCCGLFIDVTTAEQFAVKDDSIRMNFFINNRLGANAALQQVSIAEFDTTISTILDRNKNFAFAKTMYVSPKSKDTQPYWMVEQMEEGLFQVSDQQMIAVPDVEPAYVAILKLTIEGESFLFQKPVKYKFTDPVRGELYQPLFIIPQATIMSVPNNLLFKKDVQEEKTVEISVNANKRINGKTVVQVLGFDESLKQQDSLPFKRFESRNYTFQISNKGKSNMESSVLYSMAHFQKPVDTADVYLSIRAINYDHIPSIKYLYPDFSKALNIDLKIYNKKIGYIIGAGDKVPEALEQMGYEVTLLTDKELSRNNLQQFDAIITGVRAYNTNAWMNNHYDKLMKYVSGGGNLIVQYNTSSNIGPIKAKISPYNFDISRTRVTDENARVNFTNPQHPVLNFPNRITQNDFEGWKQERSIYHASGWDKGKFETVLSMNDPGEKPDEGSLIIAKHGKGYFTYTGLVFFRELPAAVPGAYRLLANIIALNRKKAF